MLPYEPTIFIIAFLDKVLKFQFDPANCVQFFYMYVWINSPTFHYISCQSVRNWESSYFCPVDWARLDNWVFNWRNEGYNSHYNVLNKTRYKPHISSNTGLITFSFTRKYTNQNSITVLPNQSRPQNSISQQIKTFSFYHTLQIPLHL